MYYIINIIQDKLYLAAWRPETPIPIRHINNPFRYPLSYFTHNIFSLEVQYKKHIQAKK